MLGCNLESTGEWEAKGDGWKTNVVVGLLSMLVFADDLVLMAENAEDQRIMVVFREFVREWLVVLTV